MDEDKAVHSRWGRGVCVQFAPPETFTGRDGPAVPPRGRRDEASPLLVVREHVVFRGETLPSQGSVRSAPASGRLLYSYLPTGRVDCLRGDHSGGNSLEQEADEGGAVDP
eukprot:7268248-Pyramimonas_sp.AAC.1